LGRKRRRKSVVTRTVSQRIRKWDAKVRGDVYAEIMKTVKPIALERFSRYQPIHDYLINVVRSVINQYGIDYGIMQEYVWYAQGLWYLTQKYRSKALQVEADATFCYYVFRGRDESILRAIAKRLGIEISDWNTILMRVGIRVVPLTEEVVYRGTKRALVETLERVETDLTDIEITYDAENRPIEIIKTDKVTGKKKKITLEYDAVGNLIKKTEEWL